LEKTLDIFLELRKYINVICLFPIFEDFQRVKNRLGFGYLRNWSRVYMVMTSCIRHPEKSRYISLHAWQVEFCHGNHCAAYLLSFFACWHDWKLKHDSYYRRCNDISEIHGDDRIHNENAYMFFSTEQLIEGCLGAYGKTAIKEALDLLAGLNVISIHKNPNKRYHFDKTKYFIFYPEICNRWIDKSYLNQLQHIDFEDDLKIADRSNDNESIDELKIVDRHSENSLRSTETSKRFAGNRQAITNTTNNTTNKKQSIKSEGNFLNNEKLETTDGSGVVEAIVNALVDAGMPETQLTDVGDVGLLADLANAGATPVLAVEAYRDSVRATEKRGAQFGVRYLAKVIRERLNRPQTSYHPKAGVGANGRAEVERELVYKSDYENARSFAADLI
jgi:hypothetical protein